MIQEMQEIPSRLRAVEYELPVEEPVVFGELGATFSFGFRDVAIPSSLTQRFLKQCRIENVFDYTSREDLAKKIKKTLEEKRIILRGKVETTKDFENSVDWFAVVSEEFKPVYPRDVHAILKEQFGEVAKIRFIQENDSVHIAYPMHAMIPGLHMYVDTGRFGLYGGDAQRALRSGIAWFNPLCRNWTLFLGDFLQKEMGKKQRVIHRGNGEFYDTTLVGKLEDAKKWASLVAGKIGDSTDIEISKDDLEDYLDIYVGRGLLNQNMREALLARIPEKTNLYNVAYDMTELCQKMTRTGSARSKVEYLAGELLLCHERIFEEIRN